MIGVKIPTIASFFADNKDNEAALKDLPRQERSHRVLIGSSDTHCFDVAA